VFGGGNKKIKKKIKIKKLKNQQQKKQHRCLNLLAKINRSTEKYHYLLKRALTIIIGLLYLQPTDQANVP
jgi:hypothetical protein